MLKTLFPASLKTHLLSLQRQNCCPTVHYPLTKADVYLQLQFVAR